MQLQILNSKKMKYALFQPIFEESMEGDINKINIFIDIWSVLSNFYQKNLVDIFSNIDTDDKYIICPELLNICAHYRHFFWSRYKISTDIYLYYTDTPCEISKMLSYKMDFNNKHFNDNDQYNVVNKIISKNLRLLRLIIDYVPRIYLINSYSMDYSLIPSYLINTLNLTVKNNERNMILTNDKISYQYAELPNTFILTLKSDKSKIIISENLMDELLKNSKKKDNTCLIPSFYKYVYILAGYKKFNMSSFKSGYGNIKIISLLEKMIEENLISNINYKDISDIINGLEALNLIQSDNEKNQILDNYSVFNLTRSRILSDSEMLRIDQQIVDKNNYRSVIEVNEKYFTKNPILTDELTETLE